MPKNNHNLAEFGRKTQAEAKAFKLRQKAFGEKPSLLDNSLKQIPQGIRIYAESVRKYH